MIEYRPLTTSSCEGISRRERDSTASQRRGHDGARVRRIPDHGWQTQPDQEVLLFTPQHTHKSSRSERGYLYIYIKPHQLASVGLAQARKVLPRYKWLYMHGHSPHAQPQRQVRLLHASYRVSDIGHFLFLYIILLSGFSLSRCKPLP